MNPYPDRRRNANLHHLVSHPDSRYMKLEVDLVSLMLVCGLGPRSHHSTLYQCFWLIIWEKISLEVAFCNVGTLVCGSIISLAGNTLHSLM